MANVCRLCERKDRELDVELLLGLRSFEEVGRLTGTSKSVADRHLEHIELEDKREFRKEAQRLGERAPLPAKVVGRLNELDGQVAPSLEQILGRLMYLETLAIETLEDLRARGDFRSADSSIRTTETLIKHIGQLAGYLNTSVGPTVIVLSQSPEFLRLQSRVIEALQPWPLAALAVADCLALPVVVEAQVVE